MRTTRLLYLGLVAVGITVLLAASAVRLSGQQSTGAAVRIDNDDIGGVVASANGPEAGVWVIAETTGLPTKFAKIVVTDDQGRYVLPDLPKANYSVWVRGYGLVDSPKVKTAPGKILNLRAVVAPSPAAAAEYYPAIYWYSMLKIPEKSEFPETGPKGNGKRDEWVEPNQPVDPTKDKRVAVNIYSVGVSPVDGSVWGGSMSGFPGYVVRVNPGPNPSETALAEIYEPPLPGYGPRGGDIDRNGVFWASLASGHLGSFDRRKCKGPLNGPNATGKHCPEGWTLYPLPGPQFQNVTDSGSAEASYYTWVDQFDTFGLGKDVPIATGNLNDALLALVDGKFVNLRVPYPMGFYAKWMDARIDNPKAGWKGKGLWSTYATRTPFHLEGGKGTTSKVVKFQLRPDPLAK